MVAFAVLTASAGCATRGSDERGMALELEIARLRAAEQRQRMTELEARLARVEEAKATPEAGIESPEVLERLDRLIALNEEVLLQDGAATSREELAPIQSQPDLASMEVPVCDPSLTPQQQLQRFVERLRGRRTSWRGGLSREEAEAVRVLLRPERSLDADNPLKHW